MNVFVIEDNEQNLYLVNYLLESAGHTVLSASDGETGIPTAIEAKPDIILLDIQLPGMDGHQVAQQLRLSPVLDTVPIVAITSYAMNGDRVRALEAGCDAYMEKPINPDNFVARIEEISKKKRQ